MKRLSLSLSYLLIGSVIGGCTSLFAPNNTLQPPELIVPEADAPLILRPIAFDWEASREWGGSGAVPVGLFGSVTYTLRVSKAQDMSVPIYEVEDLETTHHLAPLSAPVVPAETGDPADSTFFWQVEAKEDAWFGGTTESEIRKFILKEEGDTAANQAVVRGHVTQNVQANVALVGLAEAQIKLTRSDGVVMVPQVTAGSRNPYCFGVYPPPPAEPTDPDLCVVVMETFADNTPAPVEISGDAAELDEKENPTTFQLIDGTDLDLTGDPFELDLTESTVTIEIKGDDTQNDKVHPHHNNAGVDDDSILVIGRGNDSADPKLYFDPNVVNYQETHFGPNGAIPFQYNIADYAPTDGLLDVEMKFKTSETGISCDPEPETMTLVGENTAGDAFFSAEDISVDTDCNAGCH